MKNYTYFRLKLSLDDYIDKEMFCNSSLEHIKAPALVVNISNDEFGGNVVPKLFGVKFAMVSGGEHLKSLNVKGEDVVVRMGVDWLCK